MIIELSKDKSLLNILSKAELDNETKRLVECGASTSIIKRSLERNLNSSNITQYRRYIAKAEDDEAYEDYEEEEFDLGDATVEELEDKTEADAEKDKEAGKDDEEAEEEDEDDEYGSDDLDEDAFEVDTKEQSKRSNLLAIREIQNNNKYAQGSKKAYTQLSIYNKYLKPINEIAASASVIEKEIKGKKKLNVMGVNNIYKKMANTQSKSDHVVNVFQQLGLEGGRTFLTTKYRPYLIQGEYKGKKFSSKDGNDGTSIMTWKDDKAKDINVKALQAELFKFLELKFPVENSAKQISFFQLIELLHVSLYNAEPKVSVDRPKAKTEYTRGLDFLRGSNPKVDDNYQKQLKKITAFKRTISGLKNQLTKFNESQQELEELTEDTNMDKFISDKVNKLTAAYRTLIARGGATQENIKSMGDELKEIRNNSDKYIDEAREELEEKIESELVKIEEVKKQLERFDTVRPYIKTLSGYYYKYEETPAPDVIKKLISRASSLVIRMHGVSIDMNEHSTDSVDALDDSIEELLRPKGKDNGDNPMGISLINSEEIASMNELSMTMEKHIEDFKAVLNQLDEAIEGSGGFEDYEDRADYESKNSERDRGV